MQAPHRVLSGTTGHFSSFARNHSANVCKPSEAKKSSSKCCTCPLTSLRVPATVTTAGFSCPISPNRQSFILNVSRSHQSCNPYNFRRPMIQNHIQKHYPRVLFLRCKSGWGYALVFEGQSEGGKATLQKLGAGCVNSTATVGGPVSSLFTETTLHSCCSPLPVFCKISLCLRATMPFRANSAPCALTTIVFVLSENCGPSFGGLWTTTETLRSIRWLRRS